MSSKEEQLLRAAYKGFNQQDIEAVLSLMHPDVDWPNGMEGGRVHGRSQVRDYWTRQFQMIHPQVEPQSFTPQENGSITVTVHQVIRSLDGNLLADQMVQHVYRIQDSLIQRM